MDHSCNFAIASLTRRIAATELTNGKGIEELVDVIGDATKKTIRDCAEIFSPGADREKFVEDHQANFMENLGSGEVNGLFFSDWSKFGFYKVDFGWGRPIRVGIGPLPLENMIVLMDDKEGDGIEAWVHLNHNDMSCFEQDQDIRLFTT